MFKPRQPRQKRNQPQNPISEMEQFYLNQYFQTSGNPQTTGPLMPSEASQNNQRFPPVEFARLHQLEQRIARIEQYLGFSTEPSFDTSRR